MTQSKALARLLTAVGAAILAVALLAPAASAKEPAPGYSQFAGCPSQEESSSVELCVRSEITGGHLTVGKKTVPIENPLVLSGGTDGSLENFQNNSKGGLTKVRQKVPGGVVGLTGLTWLLEFFGSDALTLYAVTELAAPPTGFDFQHVTIPIKVHLENTTGLLGNSCYIGSNSSPITLKLTNGTTEPPPPAEPISGKEPEVEIDEEHEIIKFENGVFVDNAFSAPGASGCVLHLFGFIPISLNGFVNEQSGVPSAAGYNEAVQNYNLELTERELVYP